MKKLERNSVGYDFENKINEIISWINQQEDIDAPLYEKDAIRDKDGNIVGIKSKPEVKDKCLYCGSEKVNGAWICMCPIGHKTKSEVKDDYRAPCSCHGLKDHEKDNCRCCAGGERCPLG